MASDNDTTDFDSEIGKDFKRMKDGYIRSREGRIIARFDRNWIRSGDGKLIARYDSGDGRTRTREGAIVGSGDLRLLQIGKERPTK
jgi:hypothetical protein